MATQAQAYDSSNRQPSGNLSPFRLKKLVEFSGIPLPQKNLILAAIAISKNAGIVVWSSVGSLSTQTKMSERTIYHRRLRMKRLNLWEKIRDPFTWDDCPKCGARRELNRCTACGYRCDHAGHNPSACPQFRRPPTFRLNVDRIASWPLPQGVRPGSYAEYKASSAYPANDKKSKAESGHRSAQRSQQEKPGPVPVSRQHGISRGQERMHKLRQNLGIRMAQLRKGCQGSIPGSQGLVFVSPGDPRYQAAMTHEEAERAVAKEFGLTLEEVQQHLREMGWKYSIEKRE